MSRAIRVLLASAFLVPLPGAAQEGVPHRIVPEPASLQLAVGGTGTLTFAVLDRAGNPVDVPLRTVAPRGALEVGDGEITARAVGEHQVTVTEVVEAGEEREPLRVQVPVMVRWPALERVEVTPPAGPVALYAGTTLRFRAAGHHGDGSPRDPEDLGAVSWAASDREVATVDRFGNVTAHRAGEVEIRAEAEGVRGAVRLEVPEFPGATLELVGGEERVRTGDVQRLHGVVRAEDGEILEAVPVTWSLQYAPPPDILAPRAPGRLEDGRVVADIPGEYTVIASAGPLSARFSFEAEPRDVVERVQVVGHARQDNVRTTDFWVFEGRDGRDYVITGAKRSDGHAYVFDVTEPGNMVKTDSVQVDARSVNDVKVSPDGRYATLTREGASDRINGLVILDLADPAHPTIAAEVTEGLTGGVHNAFPTNDHVFALSAGEKYVILDMTDIENPRYVSEVQHEDCRIHDVWVHLGIAYSAQWGCGVIAYDVGNGAWGGSIEEPVHIASFEVPDGRTHAVFPYHQESTGRFYLFIGDEIMNRRGRAWQGVPGNYQLPYDPETGEGGTILTTAGYIQIIDFTDPESPEMVARYEVEEYGTHNIWVEDDVLYQAHYEGGLRIVDVSGELRGNLYSQGREIAVYKSADPVGYVPNSPMVWSAMPYKGLVFFTDTNSGVWAVELLPEGQPVM